MALSVVAATTTSETCEQTGTLITTKSVRKCNINVLCMEVWSFALQIFHCIRRSNASAPTNTSDFRFQPQHRPLQWNTPISHAAVIHADRMRPPTLLMRALTGTFLQLPITPVF